MKPFDELTAEEQLAEIISDDMNNLWLRYLASYGKDAAVKSEAFGRINFGGAQC